MKNIMILLLTFGLLTLGCIQTSPADTGGCVTVRCHLDEDGYALEDTKGTVENPIYYNLSFEDSEGNTKSLLGSSFGGYKKINSYTGQCTFSSDKDITEEVCVKVHLIGKTDLLFDITTASKTSLLSEEIGRTEVCSNGLGIVNFNIPVTSDRYYSDFRLHEDDSPQMVCVE